MNSILNFAALTMMTLVATSVLSSENEFSGYERNRNIQVGKTYSLEEGSRIRRSFSVLKRNDDGICLTANLKKLDEGAYTAWWLIFNNPEACKNPRGIGGASCDYPDLGNPAVDATIMWARPLFSGVDGKAHLSVCLGLFETSHVVGNVGTQDGLTHPKNAEIHLDVRNHGRAAFEDAQLLGEQLNSFQGGCETSMQTGFECSEVQSVIFRSRPNRK